MYDCRCENKTTSWRCDFNPFAFGNKRATKRHNSPSFVARKTAMIMTLFKRSFGLTRSLLILYVHEHDRIDFGMLTVETAVFPGCIWLHFFLFRSSRNRKGQSFPVEYYLELVEEYLKGKMHKSEPESGNGNVNTVYFVHQERENTQVCLWWTSTRLQMFTYIFELPA